MIIAYERPAVGTFNPFKLKFGGSVVLAAIGNGSFDRAKFKNIVFAPARADEQQQYKPNGLPRHSHPNARCLAGEREPQEVADVLLNHGRAPAS